MFIQNKYYEDLIESLSVLSMMKNRAYFEYNLGKERKNYHDI